MIIKKGTALVVFGKDFSFGRVAGQKFDTVVADKLFQKDAEALGCKFVDLESLIGPGSVYEASALLEEISYLKLPDGSRVTKSLLYKGYELWWMHYDSLFYYFCLPYTQYKNLLVYLKDFQTVHFYNPPYKNLFSVFLEAHGSKMIILKSPGFKSPSFLPFGVLLQIILTFLSLLVLVVSKRRLMVFIGDKFEKGKDYDFRMGFVYKEMRHKQLRFVEFVRSLEPWKIILQHALVRRRPVVYSEGVAFAGRFLSVLSGGRRQTERQFGFHRFAAQPLEERFKLSIATHYLLAAYDDIWAIRIMRWILRIAGVRAAFIPAAVERNFHAALGCKLNTIPTVGIMHGVASRYGTPYDFLPGFDGEKTLSVDSYGVWSEWWRREYIKNSDAYNPEQLFVSGPMRPLEVSNTADTPVGLQAGPMCVLYIAEQTAMPAEILPYLRELISCKDILLTIKFRPYRDGFEEWLLQNEPQLLSQVKVIKGAMQEAIQRADVVVGCHSTGVLEALLQSKVPVFIRTQKWGDYYTMTGSEETKVFFAENPAELIERIKTARTLPKESIAVLCEQYFGDPHKNGSAWAVGKLEQLLKERGIVSEHER